MDVDVDVEKESLLQGQEVLFKGRELQDWNVAFDFKHVLLGRKG